MVHLAPFALLLFSFSAHAALEPVFILERSTNANRLVYEADLAAESPIHPYWEMRAQDGHREELNSFERNNVYGTKILAQGETIRFEFRGLPGVPVTLAKVEGRLQAQMLLGGEACRLKRIFLELTDSLFPKVKTITIECLRDDGQDHATTLFPGSRGNWQEKTP